jgi:acetyl esterase/lipase
MAIEERRDVQFATGGGRPLLCDLYLPDDRGNAPAVILLHGGAWRMGSRAMVEGYGRILAQAGLVCVAPEYRLTPEAAWPAQIHDAKACIRWTRACAADLGADSARLAILGRSAGGHLALLAAGTPGLEAMEGDGGHPGVDTSVAAVIGIFPPTLMFSGTRPRGGTPATALMGEGATEEAARLASPVAHVGEHYPPTFLLHGTEDRVVPPSASMVMYEALVAADRPVEMHLYAGQPHGFAGGPEFIDLCASEIAHFLNRVFAPVSTEATAAV